MLQPSVTQSFVLEKMEEMDKSHDEPLNRVEHFYVDFKRYALSRAIKNSQNNLENSDFTDYDLAQLLLEIFEQSRESIEDFKTFRILVDHQFDKYTIHFFNR